MFYMWIAYHYSDVVDAILKGACGNTSIKKLTIQLFHYRNQERLKAAAAAAELRQARPQLELHVY